MTLRPLALALLLLAGACSHAATSSSAPTGTGTAASPTESAEDSNYEKTLRWLRTHRPYPPRDT